MNENIRQALGILAKDDAENGPEVLDLSDEDRDRYYRYNRAQQSLCEAMLGIHPGGLTAEQMVAQVQFFIENWILPERASCEESKITPLREALKFLKEGEVTPLPRPEPAQAPPASSKTVRQMPDVVAGLPTTGVPATTTLEVVEVADSEMIGRIVDRLEFTYDDGGIRHHGACVDQVRTRFAIKALVEHNQPVVKVVHTTFSGRARLILTPWGRGGQVYYVKFEVRADRPEQAAALLALLWATVGSHIEVKVDGSDPGPVNQLAGKLQEGARPFKFIS